MMRTEFVHCKDRTRSERDFDKMVHALVRQAVMVALEETCHGIRASNDDVTPDQAFDLAWGVIGEHWLIDKVVDAACDVMCEDELPELEVAQARVTAAACTAAQAAFAMRHQRPAGRA